MSIQLADLQLADLEVDPKIERVEAAVRLRLAGRLRDFRVTKNQMGLVLYGFAHSYHAKQLAQHAVMETTTLPIAANEIEVR